MSRKRVEGCLFLAVFAAYAYFYQAGSWNSNSRFDLVRSLVEQGTTRIDAFHANTGDKARREGHFYSDKAPGAAWFALPAFALFRVLSGPAPPLPPALYFATLTAVGLPSALAVVLLFRFTARLEVAAPAGAALALAWGLATLALPYSTLYYGHQLLAALLVTAFYPLAALRLDRAEPRPIALAVPGFLLGLAIAVEYPAVLAALVLASYACSFVRPRRRLLWLAAGAVPPLLMLGLYHWAAFGGPFTLAYSFSTEAPRHRGFFMGLGAPDLRVVFRLLFSPYRGLFFSAPWLLAALPGAVLLVRGRRFRPEALVCLAILALQLWLNASLWDWHGGWATGPRHLVSALPFLTLAAAGLCSKRRLNAVVTGACFGAALVSGFLMLAATAVRPEAPRHVSRPFADFVLPAFVEGRLAINTQGVEGQEPGDTRKAWNLGQLAGLEGRLSLAPLLALQAFLLLCLWRVLGAPPPRFVSVVAGALAAEIVLALVIPAGWRLWGDRAVLPASVEQTIRGGHASGLDRPITVWHNSLGFRGPEPGLLGPALPVIAIGGRTTASPFQSDDKDWPHLVGSRLGSTYPALSITNAGVSGLSTFGLAVLLQEGAIPLEPRLVLILPGIEDVGRLEPTKRDKAVEAAAGSGGWPRDMLRRAGRHCALLATALALSRRQVAPPFASANASRFELGARSRLQVDTESVRQAAEDNRLRFVPAYRERLAKLLRLSRAAGAEPVLLTQPALYGPGTDDPSGVALETVAVDEDARLSGAAAWAVLETYNDALRGLATDEGVSVIDLARQLPKSSSLFHGFVDFTNLGAERVSEIVAAELPALLTRRGFAAAPAGS